jgi:hypothetical protein
MLYDEDSFHLILAALFDSEWLVLEGFNGARGREFNSDVGSTLDFLQETMFSQSVATRRRNEVVPKPEI